MSHQATSADESNLILPVHVLVVLGALFVGSAFFLIPKEEELVNRFIEDNNSSRAHDLVKEAREKEVKEQTKAWLEEAQRKLAAAATAIEETRAGIDPGETLRAFLGEGTCRPGDVEFSDLVIAVRSADTPRSREILQQLELAGSEESLGTEKWKTLEATVAEKALAEGNPPFAADLLISACQLENGMTSDWERVRMAVQSCRWSERSQDAEKLLSKFEIAQLPEDLVALRITLLQETERNAEAFKTATEYISSLGEGAKVPQKIMELTEQSGLYSGQEEALLPYYRRHLSSTAIGQMEWEKFLAAADAGELEDPGTYARYAWLLAQICEWNNLPAEGFDHYRKLAVLGNFEATARCLDLYTGLARQMDMEEILARVIPPEGADGDAIARQHLQLLGDNGLYEKAIPTYGRWLAKNPDDVEGWAELALLFDEMGDFEASMDTCRKALALHGDHIGLRAQLARRLQSCGRYEESLAILREFTPEEHDAITREDYELLSEAVGSWEDLNKAIRLSMQAKAKPTVDQFESLARSCELIGDPEGECKALENGLVVHPESKTLAINLASIFIDQGKFDQAASVLTSENVKDDVAAICLLIDTAERIEDPQLVYNHLGPAAHKRYNLPAASLMALSEIYQVAGRAEAAADIYQHMPMGPNQWEMIAELRYNQKRYEEAKRYQLMVTENSVDHSAWMFLGEILQEMGDAPAAEEAFKKSLNLLRARIVSGKDTVAGR